MIKKEQNGIVWFEFELLQSFPELRHAVFSRIGGSSLGPFSGLNFSTKLGDDASVVQANFHKAKTAIGLTHTLSLALQVHGDHVYAIANEPNEPIANCDGLLTNMHNLALGIKHADCQAAIFFDPVQKAIGCIHAGWRGNCQNIYKKAIDKMKQQYGSKAEDIIACLSPSLGPEKAEFINYKLELPESFWQYKDSKNYFNLWDIAHWQLTSEGIDPKKIEIAKMCTFSDPEHFYSHRRDKITGRHLACVWLNR